MNVAEQSPGIGTGMRTVVMISGGGTNLQAIINEVLAGGLPIELRAVVCDRPGVLGLERAEQAGVPTCVIDYVQIGERARAEAELAATLEGLSPELVVLAGFMRILPDTIVDTYRGRMLNIHPSLLPKFRGLNTHRRALDAGERWHGSTVHFVIPALDAGPSIIQYRVAIHADETEASLQERVQQGEYLIYPRAIGWLASGRLRLRDDEAWLDGLPLDEPVRVDEQ